MYVALEKCNLRALIHTSLGFLKESDKLYTDVLMLDTDDCVVESYDIKTYKYICVKLGVYAQSSTYIRDSIIKDLLNGRIYVLKEKQKAVCLDKDPVIWWRNTGQCTFEIKAFGGLIMQDIVSYTHPVFELTWAKRFGEYIRVIVRLNDIDGTPFSFWLLFTDTEFLGIERIYRGSLTEIIYSTAHKPSKHIMGKLTLADIF